MPRLYVVAPPVDDPAKLAHTLAAVVEAADIAAVLLRLPQGGERALLDYAKTIAPAIQAKGAALLFDGNCELVARAGADGAHLTGIAALTAALDTLKPERIAGAGGLRTRHDAMLAGERGADYLMFGEPDVGPRRVDEIVERVAWWAELFEVPCVAYAEHLDEVATLAAAGADFVALGEFAFSALDAASDLVRAAAERLAQAAPSARAGADRSSSHAPRREA
jgi:thiamine-phosphate pyrophosphorylase